MTLPPDQIRRRVKAARALAGLSIPDLAKAVDEPGLGDRTLRAMEGEKGRPFRKMELEAIARVCGVPYAFFTIDFDRLDELEERTTIPVAHIHQGAADLGADIVLMDGERVIGQVEVKQVQEIAGVAAENAVAKLLADLSASDAQDLESALVAFTRRAKAVAVGPPADGPRESAAAPKARDEADATEGSIRAADEATPGTEGQTAP